MGGKPVPIWTDAVAVLPKLPVFWGWQKCFRHQEDTLICPSAAVEIRGKNDAVAAAALPGNSACDRHVPALLLSAARLSALPFSPYEGEEHPMAASSQKTHLPLVTG